MENSIFEFAIFAFGSDDFVPIKNKDFSIGPVEFGAMTSWAALHTLDDFRAKFILTLKETVSGQFKVSLHVVHFMNSVLDNVVFPDESTFSQSGHVEAFLTVFTKLEFSKNNESYLSARIFCFSQFARQTTTNHESVIFKKKK